MFSLILILYQKDVLIFLFYKNFFLSHLIPFQEFLFNYKVSNYLLFPFLYLKPPYLHK